MDRQKQYQMRGGGYRGNGHLPVKPFLRWAGGKSKIVKLLAQHLPAPTRFNRYIEPFFGAGALYFFIGPRTAVISDLNEELVNCYRQIASDPIGVSRILACYKRLDSERYYYRKRAESVNRLNPLQRAARFIYFNKAAFNGLYRVNRKGQFNVPYGPSPNGPALPTRAHLEQASELLKNATIVHADYRSICDSAIENDFVYIDPPYPPASNTAYFTHYTASRFGWKDQEEVAEVFREMDSRGCMVMMTNTDRNRIRTIMRGYRFYPVEVTRWLGSNGDRYKVGELVITNYDPHSSS